MDEVVIEVLAEDEAQLPLYATDGAAGADVRAHLKEPMILEPGCSGLVPTGLKLQIPSGYEVQVRPRSGIAFKAQVTVLNAPGTIDSDYRGELKILLINHGKEPFTIEPDMRIAQIIVSPVVRGIFLKISQEQVSTTARGLGGFGHTGVN